MLLFGIAAAAFAATMLGGFFAIKLRDRLHLILGFGAGAVVAVAFFDLLPEALELAGDGSEATILSFVALGFLCYLLLDRVVTLHQHHHEEEIASRGKVRAGSFAVHSFLDGVGIGLAFQVNEALGVLVAVAVLAHGFSDGINTANAIMRHGGGKTKAMRWLMLDAVAPVVGIAVSLFLSVSEQTLAPLLAMFAGFFLYIGASDLIPESHHAHPKFLTTLMTILGMGVLYTAIKLAGM